MVGVSVSMVSPVVRVIGRTVRHESYSGVRITRQVVVVQQDGTETVCKHTHGHRTDSGLHSCAIRLTSQVNGNMRVSE